MRSRLSRRARETSCSMAEGELESDDIRLGGLFRACFGRSDPVL
jgi:hypothetical protein